MLVYGSSMPTATGETNKHIVIVKRKIVKELKAKHFSKTQIQKKLAVTPDFVRRWWDKNDVREDRRGWQKGKLRVYSQEDADRIIAIRENLLRGRTIFFGSETILYKHKQEFPNLKLPSLSFVARTLKNYGLVKRYQKRVKFGSRYQHYPAKTIFDLGQIIEEADFTGRRILKGYKNPLHFWARVYLKPFRLPRITRIASPSGQQAADELVSDWKKYPLPDVLKLDNDTAYYSAGKHADRWLSRFICWLLNLGIIPVFSAFNKPWNNGSVEGLNSVFVKKIWIQQRNQTINQLDGLIEQFNYEYGQRVILPQSTRLASDYVVDLKKVRLSSSLKNPTIYFTRQVESMNEQACIRILKVPIYLPDVYLKQFVLVKLAVYQEQLTIYYETESGKLEILESLRFPVKYH